MKILRLNTLWAKMSFAIFILVVLMMTMVTYLFTISQFRNQRQELRQNMHRIAKQIATIRLAETDGGYYVYQDWIEKIINSDAGQDLVYIAIFDKSDSLKAFVLNQNWLDIEDLNYLTRQRKAAIVRALANNQIARESRKDFDHVIVDILVGEERIGKVDVGFSLIEFNNSMQEQLLLNLEVLALFSIIGIIGAVLMSLHISRPVNELSTAMNRVSRGDLEQKISSPGEDEIGQLARSFNRLVEGLREKQVIETFSDTLAFTLELDKLTLGLVKQLVASVDACGGVLLLNTAAKGGHSLYFSQSYPPKTIDDRFFHFSPRFWQNCLSKNHFQIEPDTASKLEKGVGLKIERAFPIKSKSKLLGVVCLGRRADGNHYSRKNIQLLQTLLSQAALALENIFLLDELTEKERLKRELEIAKNVQKRLLPADPPCLSGIRIAAVCEPATEVGGDYYDFFKLSDHQLGVVVADVAGKGTFAAFYMAELKGMMTSLAHSDLSPLQLVRVLNTHLYQSLDKKSFATMAFAVIDSLKKELIFVRAGHTGLLKKEANSSTKVVLPPGLGVGLTNHHIFSQHLQQQTIPLRSNDILVFYTDGISEAMNKEWEEYGEERLIQCLDRHSVYKPQKIIDTVLSDVNTFVGSSAQHDDLTMVVISIE